MKHPKYQGQHRISQVYLRQFGYFKDQRWYISVWDKSKNFTDYVLIENFTKETNVFDLPFFESFDDKRHFENKNVIVESHYQKVINTIHRQKQLTPQHRDVLCHYIPNLICRAKPYRELFQNYLEKPILRNAFLSEITMFKPDEMPILETSLSLIPKEYHLNYVVGHIMNFFVNVFRSFNYIILKDYGNRGWFTSDNPVIIDSQESYDDFNDEYKWTIPIESEIYFPLSPDYCAFLYHPNSTKISNPLRNLKVNKVVQIDEHTHETICKKIISNTSDYFIFNQEVKPFSF